MQEPNLIQACLDEIRHVERSGEERQVPREDVPAILATPGIASELVEGAACAAVPDWRVKLDLLKVLVERARLDSVGRCRLGERFLSEARVALDALVARGGLDEHPAVGLTRAFIAVEVALRSLVAHDEQDHEGWSASGSLRIDPGVSGRGLSLGIAPRWGTPVTGVDRLWAQHDPAEPRDTRASGSGTGLAAELGYGLRAPVGRGVLTPYTGAEWTDDGVRAYRLGARWEVTPRASLGLEGTHRESGGADGSGNALALRASVRW